MTLKKFKIPLLYRYILLETVYPFLISLSIFTGLLLLARILKLVDLVVNKNVPLSDTLILFSYIIPSFLEIAIPMSLLLGILISLGRLSNDSELIVIRSCGISIKKIAKPLIYFSILTTFVSLSIGFWVRPWANYRLGQGLFEIVKLKASAGLTAGIFNDFGPLTIYAETVDDKSGKLNNILISDRRDPELNRNFIARYGQILSDNATRTLSLQLYDGSIQEGIGLNFNYTLFQSNQIKLPQSELLDDNSNKQDKRAQEMYVQELLKSIDAYQSKENSLDNEDSLQLARYRVEFQKRLVIPLACIIVSLLAISLGIQPTRSSKSWGASANIFLGILIILAYYLILGFVAALCSQKVIPIFPAMWIPNILFFALGLYWFRKIGSEQWLAVSYTLNHVYVNIISSLRSIGRS